MLIIILLILVAVIVAVSLFVIRRDLAHEDSALQGLSLSSAGEKSFEGRLGEIHLIKAPFSRTQCIGCRYEVRQSYEKTMFDKRGKSSHQNDWDILASGQKILDFQLKNTSGQTHPVEASHALLVGPPSSIFQLAKAGLQKRDDLLNFLKSWKERDDYVYFEQKSLSTVDIKQYQDQTLQPEDSSLYIFEYLFLPNDRVTLSAKPLRGKDKKNLSLKLRKLVKM
ncbi:hypothetical protein IID04_02870 [PVC group bacterium]|nr:hypothetical protein [PVC group bacterium]